MSSIGGEKPVNPDDSVADLLQNLNLTAEEGDMAVFSDDEEDADVEVVEFALVGKVLSPAIVHPTTIVRAMKPAWFEDPIYRCEGRKPLCG